MDIVHSLSLMDNLTDAWVSILNCKWPDGHSGGRDLWQDTDPLCSLAPGKRQLKKPLVSGWNTGSIAPLDKSLLSGVPDYFYRNKILSGGDLSHYSSASLY